MSTLVCFHAHPDDECIGTGGIIRQAVEAGHRVVLVIATKGECGEVAEGFLHPGEELWERRVRETEASAAVLGVHRVEFLGYVDSGMIGTPTNDAPECFWQADVEEAAQRLAGLLREEAADVLTVYDDNGAYGHPDHIQVHRVGMRAAELADTKRVLQSTINRDHMARGIAAARAAAADATAEGADGTAEGTADGAGGVSPDELPDLDAMPDFGKPESVITTAIDVVPWLDFKRQAMRAHASQISEQSFFLAMPDEQFATAFGIEWFIEASGGPGITSTSIFDG